MTANDDLPEFPMFEMDDAEAAFGCSMERYVGKGYEDGKSIGHQIERKLRAEANAAAMIFHQGGRLADYGFRVKPGMDSKQVHRALQALLRSFMPSHEAKMGTAALAIHRWCDPIPAEEMTNAEPSPA